MKIIDYELLIKAYQNGKFTVHDSYEWVDYVMRHKNDSEIVMPVKSKFHLDEKDYFMVMPCFFLRENVLGVKVISRHSNRAENKPTMLSDIFLYDAASGNLRTIIDGNLITTLRTGISAAHAALTFGRKGFEVIGAIGLGNISYACFEALFAKLKGRPLFVKLYRYKDHAEKFIERFSPEYPAIRFQICDDYDGVIRDSDVVISALTYASSDFAQNDAYREGVTVIPVHTLGFQNCDLFFDRVFSDDLDQISGFKYFDRFKEKNTVTDVLTGKCEGRRNDKERILVYNYGIALHDVYHALKIEKILSDTSETDYSVPENKYYFRDRS